MRNQSGRTGVAIITVIVVLLVAAGIVFALNKNASAPGSSTKPNTSSSSTGSDGCVDQTGSKAVTVTYTTAQEFSPTCVTVKSGTTIIYDNKSSSELEVGADPHPSHTGNREVSNGQFVLTVAPGSTGTTTFQKAGTFGLHNHNHSSSTATIKVQ